VTSGGRFTGVDVTNDDEVNVNFFLGHSEERVFFG
jgi:hypothetical protein